MTKEEVRLSVCMMEMIGETRRVFQVRPGYTVTIELVDRKWRITEESTGG